MDTSTINNKSPHKRIVAQVSNTKVDTKPPNIVQKGFSNTTTIQKTNEKADITKTTAQQYQQIAPAANMSSWQQIYQSLPDLEKMSPEEIEKIPIKGSLVIIHCGKDAGSIEDENFCLHTIVSISPTGCKVRDIENKVSTFAPWENIYTLTIPPLQDSTICLALYDDSSLQQNTMETYTNNGWTTSYYYAMYYHVNVVQRSNCVDTTKVCGTIVYLSDINYCKSLNMDISEIKYRFGHNQPWFVESLYGLTHVPVISGTPQPCYKYAKAAVQYVERKKLRKQRLIYQNRLNSIEPSQDDELHTNITNTITNTDTKQKISSNTIHDKKVIELQAALKAADIPIASIPVGTDISAATITGFTTTVNEDETTNSLKFDDVTSSLQSAIHLGETTSLLEAFGMQDTLREVPSVHDIKTATEYDILPVPFFHPTVFLPSLTTMQNAAKATREHQEVLEKLPKQNTLWLHVNYNRPYTALSLYQHDFSVPSLCPAASKPLWGCNPEQYMLKGHHVYPINYSGSSNLNNKPTVDSYKSASGLLLPSTKFITFQEQSLTIAPLTTLL